MYSAVILPLFHTDTSESMGDELRPTNSITTVITALIFGVSAFSCILLLASYLFLCHHPEEEDTQKRE